MFTDVTLICGGVEFPAHKLLLSAASDYFSAMFTSGMVEAERDRVEIHGMEPGALKVLVDYCYTGKGSKVKGTL